MKEQKLKDALNRVNISDEMQNRILERTLNYRKEENIMKSKKKIITLAVAAVFVLGITAFAAATHWSGGFLSGLNISQNQMEKLVSSDKPLVAQPCVSDEHDGITVSTAQCLFDGNTIRMSFYVDGYELDKTEEPQLESIDVLLDGKPVYNYEWGFFNGISRNGGEHPIMADGSPVLEDENGDYILNYRIADGKMEIDMNLSPVNEDGERISEKDLKNKDIAVVMHNFGNVSGEWKLGWNLGEFESGVEFVIDKKLGNTGAKVTDAVIYPASAIINYDFARTEIRVSGYDENGKSVKCTEYAEPPALVGVKLKDGTVYTDLANGASTGFESGQDDKFTARVNFSRIINVDEIDSLLFVKKNGGLETEITENDCYEVSVN